MSNFESKNEVVGSITTKHSRFNLPAFAFLVCYAITFGTLLYYRLKPGVGASDALLSVVTMAIVAITACLLLAITVRILGKFLSKLFANSTEMPVDIEPTVFERRIGCVKRKVCGDKHEMQLWIHKQGALFHFEIKERYLVSVRYLGACTLDTGKPQASYHLAFEQGQQAMARLLQS